MTRGTFSLYVARHFLKNLFFVFALFVFLIIAVDMIELSRDLPSVPDASLLDIFQVAALRAPSFAENILPFATLFGAAGSLILLNRRLELVVARASGVSVWQFLAPMVVTAALVGLFASLVYGPLALAGVSASRSVEAGVFGKVRGGFSNLSTNFWLRVGQSDGGAVIRARVAEDLGAVLSAVTVYRFDAQYRVRERYDAVRAEFGSDGPTENYYVLKDAIETIPGAKSVEIAEFRLPVTITRSQLQANSTKATETSFWNLKAQSEHAVNSGRNHLPFSTQFQSLLSQPFLFATMVLLAATFSL
ncbi:MAG: LptF/LptG family permease, partial [Rhizobiaceae bacterium]